MRYRTLGQVVLTMALLTQAPVAAATQPSPTGTLPAACTWRATALSLPAGETGLATATDHAGGLSGTATQGSTYHVVGWQNGAYRDYGSAVAPIFAPTVADQNRAGTIVGTAAYSVLGSTIIAPFKIEGGTLTQLPLPEGGYGQVTVMDITDAGDITGYVWGSGSSGERRVVRWPASAPGTVIFAPGPFPVELPADADEDGSLLFLGHVLRNGVLSPLGTLPGLEFSWADSISNGHIVGYGVYNDKHVGVYWDRQLVAHVLPNSSYNLSNTNPQFTVNRDGLITGRIDEAHGGNDLAGTGYGVWDKGQWVGPFGDIGVDLPATLGDDGTVGGYRIDGNRDVHPYHWRCA